MSKSGAVTIWIDRLGDGDQAAARRLWEEYFHRMVGLAKKRLKGQQRGPADPEDVALSAFDTFCRGVENKRFSKLSDRDDLWQILVMLTARKAIDAVRREHAAKRGGAATDRLDLAELKDLFSREPTASFVHSMNEECDRLLNLLNDDEQRKIALLRFEGYTNPQIAKEVGCSLAKIERKLDLIRLIWEKQNADA